MRRELAQVTSASREAHLRQLSFLTTIAHELPYPFTPFVAGFVHAGSSLETTRLRTQSTRPRSKGQVAQITRLIGDLLEGSRIGAWKFRLERKPPDVGSVLDRVDPDLPAIDGRAQRAARPARAGGRPDGPGRSVRLVQVFGNLLENSSRYTPEGGEISLHGDDSPAYCVVVAVKDNGIGTRPKALPHVFDIFVRDASRDGRERVGLGVGLAVVRELVKAHAKGEWSPTAPVKMPAASSS